MIDKLNISIKNINSIQQNYDDCDYGDEDIIGYHKGTDTIELIKQYQQSLLLLKNNININNQNKLKEYNNQIIKFNNQIIDDIKNNLKLIYELNNNNNNINNYNNNNNSKLNEKFKIEIDENNYKFIKKIGIGKHYIYSENSELPKNNVKIALGEDCDSLLKLKSNENIKDVILLDGFKESLEPVTDDIFHWTATIMGPCYWIHTFLFCYWIYLILLIWLI